MRPERFELPTYWFEAKRSIRLSYGRTLIKSLPLLARRISADSVRYAEAVKSSVETEIKLPVASAARGRKLLRDAGFEIHVKRIFERNLVLDDDAQSLRNSERLLRVREAGKTVTCTFKGPPRVTNHKQREEREFKASSFQTALHLFAGIGFTERFRYEKYRTEFVQASAGGIATLDETPAGCFLELEGKSQWIDRTARALGFTPADYITISYSKIYLNWCAANGRKAANFVFEK